MTTPTKALIAASCLLAVGAIYQIDLICHQPDQLRRLTRNTDALAIQISLLREQREKAFVDLSAAEKMLESLQTPTNHATRDSELSAWLSRVDRLKQSLRNTPEKRIPEMQYLNSNDWLSVTLDNQLDTDAKIRTALSKLREMAKMKPQISSNIAKALQAYSKANNGALPTDPLQIRPYLNPQLSDDILQRYEAAPEIPGENDAKGVIRGGLHLSGSGRVVLQEKAPADEDYDTWSGYTEKGGWATQPISQLGKTVTAAMKDFAKANNGREASTPDQLLPYFTRPVDQTKLKEYWEASRH